jgi:hypothetical protein
MLKPECKIKIFSVNTYLFTFCQSLSVSTSYDTLIDTAQVILPNGLRYKNEDIISQIKRGDKIEIDVGYNGKLERVFDGYVTQIRPDQNMVLECEDEGYISKGVALDNNLYKQISLDDLISDNYEEEYIINGTIPNLGDFKIENNPTFMDLLVSLRQVYGITSYWKNRVLNIQPALYIEDKTTVFKTNYNIIDYGNLNYQDADQYRVVSKCISIQKDDSKIVWYAYYEDGEIVTSQEPKAGRLSTMKIVNSTDAAVKQFAIDRLEGQIFTGYVGSFVAFGKPFVRHSEKVDIKDTKLPERSGVYSIEYVNYNLNSSGLRQEIGIKYKQ